MALALLVVDDSRSFIEAARLVLERQGARVLGVAGTSAEAVNLTAELRPDVVLVDIRLGDESGLELARTLGDSRSDGVPAIILISTHSSADFADLIAVSPAAGFLPKSELSVEAIRRIVAGHASGDE